METGEIEKEIKIEGLPNPVTIDQRTIILSQMKYAIGKIKYGYKKGTGFFCYIPYNNNKLPVLITNYNILNEEFITNNKEIKITLNDDNDIITIHLDDERNIYLNEIYDITIIEIKNNDNINYFLDINDNLFIDNSEIFYEKESIYILQYPNGEKASVSYGILKNIDNYDIYHFCSTYYGSSGSPIMNLKNNKVIGIHKEGSSHFNFNKGTFLKEPFNDFIDFISNKSKNNIAIIKKEKLDNTHLEINTVDNNIENENFKSNQIKMILKIEKEDINKKIYFLNGEYHNEHNNFSDYINDDINNLNEFNTELYIDNK